MGREKEAQLSTKDAKKKAAEEAAKPPPVEEPKRKLSRIPNKVHVAKVDRVVNLGGGSGGGVGGKGGGKGGGGAPSSGATAAGDWTCPACTADCFASRSECFRCKTPRPKDGGMTHSKPAAASGDKKAAASAGAPGASAGDEAAATAEPTIILKEWQRLPRQLLQQHTDKAKAPKPDFQLHRVRGELRGKVKLKLPKELGVPEVSSALAPQHSGEAILTVLASFGDARSAVGCSPPCHSHRSGVLRRRALCCWLKSALMIHPDDAP